MIIIIDLKLIIYINRENHCTRSLTEPLHFRYRVKVEKVQDG